jgi:hypothetical protein
MRVTLSERRLSERIQQLEGINDTVEEITFKMERYAMRLFANVNEFGVRFVGMVEQSGGLGTFQFSIAGVGKDWQTGGFNFAKMSEGLNFMNPLAVSLEEADMEQICDGPVATAMIDNWSTYAHTLQKITVGEIQPAVESACLKFAWQPRAATQWTGDPALDAQLQYEEDTAQLERAGLKDPLEKYRKQQEFNEAEIAAYKAQEDAAYKARWGIDRE